MRSSGLHHVDLVVSSLERSLPFYRGLLAPLGWEAPTGFRGERGETIWYFIRPQESAYFGIREKHTDAHAIPYDRYGVGVHHVCFEADSREAVEQSASWLRDQRCEIESGPEEYSYSPGYYAVFFYDPDGLKLEVAHVPAQTES